MAKNDAKSLLKVFRCSESQTDRLAYIAAQKVCKTETKKKKMGYKREKARHLSSFDKDRSSIILEGIKTSVSQENVL